MVFGESAALLREILAEDLVQPRLSECRQFECLRWLSVMVNLQLGFVMKNPIKPHVLVDFDPVITSAMAGFWQALTQETLQLG